MGLDLRLSRLDPDPAFHARWSYGGFAEFRKRLAERVGIDLEAMVGFGGDTPWGDPDGEPLIYLLHHSDCDGELRWQECCALAPRLRSVIEAWDDINEYDRGNAMRLVDMLEEVADEDAEMVVFQ